MISHIGQAVNHTFAREPVRESTHPATLPRNP